MFNYKNISSTPGITNELNMGEECQGEAQRREREVAEDEEDMLTRLKRLPEQCSKIKLNLKGAKGYF